MSVFHQGTFVDMFNKQIVDKSNMTSLPPEPTEERSKDSWSEVVKQNSDLVGKKPHQFEQHHDSKEMWEAVATQIALEQRRQSSSGDSTPLDLE